MILGNFSLKRFLIAEEQELDCTRSQYIVALELTLLIFCPPAPELREKEKVSSENGIVIF